jgi:histone-lysine N-methyltransferase SETMAR
MFFCEQVLLRLVEDITSHSRRKRLKGILVHLDNARPHHSGPSRDCLGTTKAQRLPYPPYSPDRAPSDFFLFGPIKGKLSDFDCDARHEAETAIIAVFNGIGKETLLSVFEAWMKRVRWVIQYGGEYYHT